MKLKAPPGPVTRKRWFRGQPIPYHYPVKEVEVSEVPDKQKILNHGFDLETSFRTPKRKKEK